MTVALVKARPGVRGRVVRIEGELGSRRRMFDLGVTPGAPIEVKRVAPLGDPIEVQVRGYRLMVRKAEASLITVEID